MSPAEGRWRGIEGLDELAGERGGESTHALVLGCEEDWFVTALRSMLEPEAFEIVQATSGEEVLAKTAATGPDIVILDESLPSLPPPELVHLLLDGPLPAHVPILFHASGGASSDVEARMLDAGVWGVVEEPIRPGVLRAQIERYLRLGREMVYRAQDGELVDPETDVLTLRGLIRLLPMISNLASREGSTVTYTVIGPTEPGTGGVLTRQRRSTAELCRGNLRKADVVGWLHEGSDFAVVAYGTTHEGAEGLARRLNALVEKQTTAAELRYTLSAGILESEPSTRGPEGRNGGRDRTRTADAQLDGLQALAAAQTALREARRAGGGIRIARTA